LRNREKTDPEYRRNFSSRFSHPGTAAIKTPWRFSHPETAAIKTPSKPHQTNANNNSPQNKQKHQNYQKVIKSDQK